LCERHAVSLSGSFLKTAWHSRAFASTGRRNLTEGLAFLQDRAENEKEYFMAKTTPRQRKTAGRVMHEFKHGELKSGPGGKGGKVKSRKQAIAIALHESGTSKYDSKSEQKRNLAKSMRKEAKGETYQQEKEGKSHVGAKGRRESSRAMGGKNATKTVRSRKNSRSRHSAHASM
jgi:hypothetical protein